MAYWLIEKRDDAIGGCVQGVQSKAVVNGPYGDYVDAMNAKPSRWGTTYYIIEENDKRPEEYEKEYAFRDAQREFEDVPHRGPWNRMPMRNPLKGW